MQNSVETPIVSSAKQEKENALQQKGRAALESLKSKLVGVKSSAETISGNVLHNEKLKQKGEKDHLKSLEYKETNEQLKAAAKALNVGNPEQQRRKAA